MPSDSKSDAERIQQLTSTALYHQERGGRLRDFITATYRVLELQREEFSDTQALDALKRYVSVTRIALAAEDASILAVSDKPSELVFIHAEGAADAADLIWRRVPAEQSLAGWVVHKQRAEIVNSPLTDERVNRDVDTEVGFRTRNILAVPVTWREQVFGVIEFLNKTGKSLFTDEDRALGCVAGHVSALLLAHISVVDQSADTMERDRDT